MILRRIHLFLTMFLTPWLLIYSVSTIMFNHHSHLPTLKHEFITESETTYPGSFEEGTEPSEMALELLRHLDIEGAHQENLRKSDGKIVIFRLDPVSLLRITYGPDDGSLVVERRKFSIRAILLGLHLRSGYRHSYLVDDAWALSVDLVVVALIFWVISGLWIWWEYKGTRRLGIILTAGGLAMFIFFVFVI
ncbi:PepSY-associated TM helix domain-containing protein [Gemmatimonadota bacterium]